MRCFSPREAIAIAYYLKQAHQQKAMILLTFMSFDRRTDDLFAQFVTHPESSWLNHFCETIWNAIMAR
jgi:hypothetical protein